MVFNQTVKIKPVKFFVGLKSDRCIVTGARPFVKIIHQRYEESISLPLSKFCTIHTHGSI